jgi:hypothetical protein
MMLNTLDFSLVRLPSYDVTGYCASLKVASYVVETNSLLLRDQSYFLRKWLSMLPDKCELLYIAKSIY